MEAVKSWEAKMVCDADKKTEDKKDNKKAKKVDALFGLLHLFSILSLFGLTSHFVL